jgi:hypothetical protein
MEQDQDETIVVSRTTPMVEEETIVTSSGQNLDEATVTNPTGFKAEMTSTGPQSFDVVEDSEPFETMTTYAQAPVAEPEVQVEITIERETGLVFEAPSAVLTPTAPLPIVTPTPNFDIAPAEVHKSRPSTDASKLFQKNLNRTKRNSLRVIISVVVGAFLIGITLAILFTSLA